MHDLDRTQMEAWEGEGYPSESYAYQGEADGENRQNGQGYVQEGEGEWPNQEGWYGEQEGEWPMGSGELGYGEYQGNALNPEMPFSEADEVNLAAELLSVGSEQEFDRYMNELFITANRGQFQPGSQELFGALGGLLKNLLKKAVPIGATVLGGPVGGLAAQAFGLETEGLSPEDEQFEIARSYVRLAGAASQEAAQIPPGSPAEPAAQQALVMAAQRHAPGMMYDGQPAQAPYPKGMPKRGTWTRRGNSIMLHGYFGPSRGQGWR